MGVEAWRGGWQPPLLQYMDDYESLVNLFGGRGDGVVVVAAVLERS